MNKEHHILELKKKIEHIEKEPIRHWLGKVTKLVKIKKLEKKIKSLEKAAAHH